MKTKILAICGEAGSGKDTILHEILKLKPEFNEIISYTTRPPRDGEKEGINYYFLTEEQFKKKIENNEMLEYTVFNGWYYGTSLAQLNENTINIGVFNPAGIYELLNNSNINLKIIRIFADKKTRLLRQLNREEKPNVDEIARRYITDKDDFALFDITVPHYLYLINEDKEDLKNSLKRILEYCRPWAKEINL